MSDSAWLEGFEAFYDGLERNDNPYEFQSEKGDYLDWEGGWREAEEEYYDEFEIEDDED
jgi:ribosome modulation factor